MERMTGVIQHRGPDGSGVYAENPAFLGHRRLSIIDVADGGQRYLGIGGQELALQPGDMYIRDEAGILSSVLYGPDDRSKITPGTRQALFCVYAPPGIPPEAVASHLADIAGNVRLVAPQAAVTEQRVYTAS